MGVTCSRRFRIASSILAASAAACAFACSNIAKAQQAFDVPSTAVAEEGPRAALEFERSFQDPANSWDSKPVQLSQCRNITELTPELWSKRHVLKDFKTRRDWDQVGAIVIVKTEYCCRDSRLCAVTTACLEKKSTPMINRFRVYAGWIKGDPDDPGEAWNEWEQKVVDEYEFTQGPGARIVVMVPTWDGKMYQWQSTARALELNEWTFAERNGETPQLERFLQTAIRHAAE